MKHPTSFVLHWTAFEPHEMCGSPFISAKDRWSKRFLYPPSESAGSERKENQSGNSCALREIVYMLKSQCWKVIKAYKRASLSKWWKIFHAVIVCAVWFKAASLIVIPTRELYYPQAQDLRLEEIILLYRTLRQSILSLPVFKAFQKGESDRWRTKFSGNILHGGYCTNLIFMF